MDLTPRAGPARKKLCGERHLEDSNLEPTYVEDSLMGLDFSNPNTSVDNLIDLNGCAHGADGSAHCDGDSAHDDDGLAHGAALNGSAHDGSAHGARDGSAHGTTLDGSAHDGSAHGDLLNGSAHDARDVTFSECAEITTLIRDAIANELNVDKSMLDKLHEKMVNVDFEIAERAIMSELDSNQIESLKSIGAGIIICVQDLIHIVQQTSKAQFAEIQKKDAEGFEYTLGMERQKMRNTLQEREMLRNRIAELEEALKDSNSRAEEAGNELERVYKELDEMDILESENRKLKNKLSAYM